VSTGHIGGLVLLSKGKAIAKLIVKEDTEPVILPDPQPTYARLSGWIMVTGLFYFVSSSAGVARGLISLVGTTEHGFFWSNPFWLQSAHHVASLALSLVFVFKSEWIEELVCRKRGSKDN